MVPALNSIDIKKGVFVLLFLKLWKNKLKWLVGAFTGTIKDEFSQ